MATGHSRAQGRAPALMVCDCLVRLSGFCGDMQRLAAPEGITPALVWTRTLAEAREGTAGSSGPSGMDWNLASIGQEMRLETETSSTDLRNLRKDSVNAGISESVPREMKSQAQAVPMAVPKANPDHQVISDQIAHDNNCKVSRKRKRDGP